MRINKDGTYTDVHGGKSTWPYMSEAGTPVLRTPVTDPYNFDTFVQWRHKKLKPADANNSWDSDRMYLDNPRWYNECHRAIWSDVRQLFGMDKPHDIEAFLRLYCKDPEIVLVSVLRGCNRSNGQHIWTFRYKTKS